MGFKKGNEGNVCPAPRPVKVGRREEEKRRATKKGGPNLDVYSISHVPHFPPNTFDPTVYISLDRPLPLKPHPGTKVNKHLLTEVTDVSIIRTWKPSTTTTTSKPNFYR